MHGIHAFRVIIRLQYLGKMRVHVIYEFLAVPDKVLASIPPAKILHVRRMRIFTHVYPAIREKGEHAFKRDNLLVHRMPAVI